MATARFDGGGDHRTDTTRAGVNDKQGWLGLDWNNNNERWETKQLDGG